MRSGARLSSGVAFKGATARGKALGAHKVESALVKYTVTCDMFLSLFRRVEERREKILRKKKKKKNEGGMAGSDWASAPVTCHSSERRFVLWQLLLRVGIGAATQN